MPALLLALLITNPELTCPQDTQARSRQTAEASERWCETPEGVRHGPRMGHYPDGTLWFSGAYSHGQRTGEWKFWFPSGKPRTTSVYVNNQRHGPYQAWHETGERAEAGACEGGREAGTWTRWYPNGKPELEITFVKGEPTARRYYTRRGAPADLHEFVQGKARGAAPHDARYVQLRRQYGEERVFNACAE